MTEEAEQIKAVVRDYIVQEVLYGEEPDSLEDTTPLISGGVLDSISSVKMVTFLEEKYGIRFQAHEISANHLDTLDDIANTVQKKMVA